MITMIVTLIILGLCLYLIETYIPMAEPIKVVIRVVVILFCTLWLLSFFGIVDVPLGRMR